MQWLLNLILDWVLSKVRKALAWWNRKKTIKQESKDSVKPLEEANTAEEIEEATDDALSGF